MIKIRRGNGHPRWGAVWIDIGRLRLIWCAPDRPSTPGHPNIPGHPNKWMIVWRRKLPEFDLVTAGQWKTSADRKAVFSTKLTEADQREFGVERADKDEPDKVRLLRAFAPLACFQCDHSDAPKARKEIVELIQAIRHREPLPQGDLPVHCCRREKRGQAERAQPARVDEVAETGNLISAARRL